MKHFSTILTLLLLLLLLPAETSAETGSVNKVASPDRYSLTAMVLYGNNTTLNNFTGLDVSAHLPFNPHFETDAHLVYHNPSVTSFTAVAKPKILIKRGYLFLDGAVNVRNFAKYRTCYFTGAGSAGIKLRHILLQAGISTLVIFDSDRNTSSSDENVTEPFGLVYKGAFFLRPEGKRWNLGFGVANFTDYDYERSWEPVGLVFGHIDFSSDFTLLFNAEVRTAGRFHMNTKYYGTTCRIGVKYTF